MMMMMLINLGLLIAKLHSGPCYRSSSTHSSATRSHNATYATNALLYSSITTRILLPNKTIEAYMLIGNSLSFVIDYYTSSDMLHYLSISAGKGLSKNLNTHYIMSFSMMHNNIHDVMTMYTYKN